MCNAGCLDAFGRPLLDQVAGIGEVEICPKRRRSLIAHSPFPSPTAFKRREGATSMGESVGDWVCQHAISPRLSPRDRPHIPIIGNCRQIADVAPRRAVASRGGRLTRAAVSREPPAQAPSLFGEAGPRCRRHVMVVPENRRWPNAADVVLAFL